MYVFEFSEGLQRVLTPDLREKARITDIERQSTFSQIMSLLISSISVYTTQIPIGIPLDAQRNGKH